jgi:iron complex transport system substrate-binding protein
MWAQGNLETSCGGSTVDDLISLAGGRNVCASIPQEHAVVSLEKVLTWNPEVIVMWYNERKEPSDILKDPQWRSLRAVREKRVHEFPEIFLCDLWTLKFQYAVKMVAQWCHPALFADVDLEKEKERMIEFLYGHKIRGLSKR